MLTFIDTSENKQEQNVLNVAVSLQKHNYSNLLRNQGSESVSESVS